MLIKLVLSLWMLAGPASESFLGLECFPEKGIIKASLMLKYNDFAFDYRYTIDDDQHFEASGKIDTNRIFVSKYLEKRIHIYAGDKKLTGKLTGIESGNGELNLSFVYSYDKSAKQFRVRNLMFSEYNENQSNLLIFKHASFEKGVILTPKKTEETFRVK